MQNKTRPGAGIGKQILYYVHLCRSNQHVYLVQLGIIGQAAGILTRQRLYAGGGYKRTSSKISLLESEVSQP